VGLEGDPLRAAYAQAALLGRSGTWFRVNAAAELVDASL
jgi:hypothetical protein